MREAPDYFQIGIKLVAGTRKVSNFRRADNTVLIGSVAGFPEVVGRLYWVNYSFN